MSCVPSHELMCSECHRNSQSVPKFSLLYLPEKGNQLKSAEKILNHCPTWVAQQLLGTSCHLHTCFFICGHQGTATHPCCLAFRLYIEAWLKDDLLAFPFQGRLARCGWHWGTDLRSSLTSQCHLWVVNCEGEGLRRVKEKTERTFLKCICVIRALLPIVYAWSSLNTKTLKVGANIFQRGNGSKILHEFIPFH